MKLKTLLIKLIDFYKNYTSIFLKGNCVFFPSCSTYTKQAIEKYGVPKGILKGCLRILRCHPWQKNHLDPVVNFDDEQSSP